MTRRVDTTVRPHRCPRCGAAILRGYDAEIAAILAVVDPLPIEDQADELAAILAGRTTYDLIGMRDKALNPRDEYRIAHRRHTILAAHRCPGPVPGDALDHTPPEQFAPDDAEPPF
ncbi:hypothetical protein SMC26_40395 [Actinomadura fulvescens]